MSALDNAKEVNSGPGWYEVINPSIATTEIVRVMEDGSIYCPEGVLTRDEFAFAAAMGQAHLLIRADEAVAEHERVLAERAAPQEWEYSVHLPSGSVVPIPCRSSEVAKKRATGWIGSSVVRRRPAGPWEPLPEDTNQTEGEK